ncbi:MAG: BTAD domain-containing putative transcriptional regulator, partial [Acidimicrobiia bacterium]|nr:BTAD domain-containing putative transcriptional regulator [Acidimicrobiia bacterium]
MDLGVGVLGPLVVSAGGTPVDIGGARQRRLMAALVLHRGTVVSTDGLAEIVFEGRPTERASTTLRSYVARLRRALSGAGLAGDGIVRTEAPGYRLDVGPGQVDAERFLIAAGNGRDLLRAGDAPGAVSVLRDALALWRGTAYEEFVFEDWAAVEVARMEEERVVAGELLAEAMLACGLADEVVAQLRTLIAEYPLRERPRAHLMLALVRAGRQAEALRAFQDFRRELGEIALDPSGELVALDRGIVAQDPALLLPAPPGRALRGYRIGERLGEGRHGVVYRGVQPGVGRDVAVKTIRPALADDPEFVARFDSEAQLVSRLEHPHIVPLYDFWREPGGAFMVMRLLSSDLTSVLDAGPMTIEDSASLIGQLGAAISHAHRSGVVHGDIRASNVLVDDERNSYLSDFGLSFLAGTSAGSDWSSGYEAPEQAHGEPVTEATDQFAFAVLASHVLTGRLPFGARGISSGQDEIPSLHLHRPSIESAVDDILRRATAWDPARRFVSISDLVDALLPALGGTIPRRPATTAPRNPFLGLRAYSEADAPLFFGRGEVVAELVDRVSDDSFPCVALIGASGSGKSSLVRAGLLPALRGLDAATGDERFIVSMTPGDDPFAGVVAGLREIAIDEPVVSRSQSEDDWLLSIFDGVVGDGATVLFIDQLEELFTLAEPRDRDAFITGLVTLLEEKPSVRLVTTLRADFYDRPLRYHRFGRLVSGGAVSIVGLSAAELDQAVRGPAYAVGVDVEPALSTELVSDVIDQPAALPLLQYTLTELFERRSGSVMALADYAAIGGVDGAIARRADELLASFDIADRSMVRALFLRLVAIDADGTPVRRRVRRSDVEVPSADPKAMRRVVEGFGDARLLTFDRDRDTREPTIELAHESLILGWPTLARWVDEAGEGLLTQTRLGEAADAWDRGDRDDSELYRGARLEAAEAWSSTHRAELSTSESDFVAASVALRDAEHAEEAARLESERQTNRRLRRRLVVVGVVLVFALLAGVIALAQRNSARDSRAVADAESLRALDAAEQALDERRRADEEAAEARSQADRANANADAADAERSRADENADTARARSFAASSLVARPDDAQLALLLAIEAARVGSEDSRDPVRDALLTGLLGNRELLSVPNAGNDIAHFSPDGAQFVTLSDDPLYLDVYDVATRTRVQRLGPHVVSPGDAVFGPPDGVTVLSTAAAMSNNGETAFNLWDVATGERLWAVGPGTAIFPAFSNDGSL